METTEEENFSQNIQQEFYSEGEHVKMNDDIEEPVFLQDQHMQ